MGQRESVSRAEAVHVSPVPVDFPADNFSDNITVFPISKHWRQGIIKYGGSFIFSPQGQDSWAFQICVLGTCPEAS